MVCVYICIYVYVYVYIFIYIHTHTHTYIYTQIYIYCKINTVITFVGFAVIQGPPVVIFHPNEGPVELMCNRSGVITSWRVNGSTPAATPAEVPSELPGHTVNGENIVIVDATNNTEYICVSIAAEGNTDSDPVFLYVAGMLYHITNFVLRFSSMLAISL